MRRKLSFSTWNKKRPRGWVVSVPTFGSRGRGLESFPKLNGASFHRTFYLHSSIVSKWLKYWWKGHKTLTNPSIYLKHNQNEHFIWNVDEMVMIRNRNSRILHTNSQITLVNDCCSDVSLVTNSDSKSCANHRLDFFFFFFFCGCVGDQWVIFGTDEQPVMSKHTRLIYLDSEKGTHSYTYRSKLPPYTYTSKALRIAFRKECWAY